MRTSTVEQSVANLPSLIQREILFGNPERTSPQISPDGKYLTYVAPDGNNVLQVWLCTLGKQDNRQLSKEKKRGIRIYFWTYDSEQLIYQQDIDGDENWHFYSINIKSNIVRDLTPFQGIQAQLVALDPNFPNEMLVEMNLNDQSKHDVYRVNLRNSAVEFDTENPGNVISWIADAQLQVRAAIATTPYGGYNLLFRETTDQPWDTLCYWGAEDEIYAVSFSADGKTLYIVGNHDTNTKRLLAFDLTTHKETVIAEDTEYDLSEILIQPSTRVIQAVSFYRDKQEWQILDHGIANDFETIAKVCAGEFNIIDRNLCDKSWLVAYVTDNGPIYYYAYDRDSKTSSFLFSNQPKLEKYSLASMQPISYQARDRLTIHGYLTKPVGIPAKNLPTVLLVHGGPWVRDTWGYNPTVQWLANRGYAVLQVNFRGSIGYGKAFVNAGNREWAGKMHDDLIDAVNWLVQQGISDPRKVAIMGGSYGGYATLVGLTFTPDVFAAGVDIVGPSNLVTLMQSIPPYWTPRKAIFSHRIGNLEQEENFLKSRSPLFFVDRIQKPLLIAQGTNDPRVKQAESEQIVAAMQRVNKPAQYVLYTDEGHGFARPENRLHFYAIAEEFLAKYLGGRLEPMRNIPGHSGIIKSKISHQPSIF